MQTTNETLAALSQTTQSELFELIPIPFGVIASALLLLKKLPGFAFYLRTDLPETSGQQLSISLPDGKYTDRYGLVCACCGLHNLASKWDGTKLQTPLYPKREATEEERKGRTIFQNHDNWQYEQTPVFVARLAGFAEAKGLHTIFARKAPLWNRIMEINGFRVIEGWDHRAVLEGQFEAELVREGLSFLSPYSRGLFGGDPRISYTP
jgi:hypothetical protein